MKVFKHQSKVSGYTWNGGVIVFNTIGVWSSPRGRTIRRPQFSASRLDLFHSNAPFYNI